MLRITVHDKPDAVTFQLEGRLVGAWVPELVECWRRTLAELPGRPLRFDLTDVTLIDAEGKAFLAARAEQGAELVAAGCFTRAIVADITGTNCADGSLRPDGNNRT